MGWSSVASWGRPPRPSIPAWTSGPRSSNSTVISHHLVEAGCRLMMKPQSFLVLGLEGPLADGEEERAKVWARAVVRAVGSTV